MKVCFLDLFCTILFSIFLIAQIPAQSPLSIYIQGGVLIGTPIGAIPEGATGKLGIKALTGLEINWKIRQKLSLNIGALLSHKSNEFQTPVSGKYNISDGVLGIRLPFPINVNYQGTVNGAFSNKYVDIPIYTAFQIGKRTLMALGYQYSHLLNGRFDGKADIKALALNFPNQEFDESHLIRKDDHAVMGGMHYGLANRLELRLRFSYGLNGIFTEIPDGMSNVRNLYMGVMLAYGFGVKL